MTNDERYPGIGLIIVLVGGAASWYVIYLLVSKLFGG